MGRLVSVFLSANLARAGKLMGWAGSAYQYGNPGGRTGIGSAPSPAMLFLALVMMPFLLHFQNPFSAGIFDNCVFGEPAPRHVPALFVRLHEPCSMSGGQHVCHGQGHADCAGMGHQFQHLGLVADGGHLCNAGRGLPLRQSSMKCSAVLSLIWAAVALLIPILGLYEAGGWTNLKLQIATANIGTIRSISGSGLGSFHR